MKGALEAQEGYSQPSTVWKAKQSAAGLMLWDFVPRLFYSWHAAAHRALSVRLGHVNKLADIFEVAVGRHEHVATRTHQSEMPMAVDRSLICRDGLGTFQNVVRFVLIAG